MPITLPESLSVTIRLSAKEFMRLDNLSKQTSRSRAALVRELIRRAEPTGQADVTALVSMGSEDAS